MTPLSPSNKSWSQTRFRGRWLICCKRCTKAPTTRVAKTPRLVLVHGSSLERDTKRGVCHQPRLHARSFWLVGSSAPTLPATALGHGADGVSWPGGQNATHVWPPKKEGTYVNARPFLKPAREAAFPRGLHVNWETSGQCFHIRRTQQYFCVGYKRGLGTSLLRPVPGAPPADPLRGDCPCGWVPGRRHCPTGEERTQSASAQMTKSVTRSTRE